jgi:phospho-N-acetylmuramoyl-pentapeptide-transferase
MGDKTMLVLTKALFALMIGFISAVLFGLVIIPFLKKLKFRQRINVYVEGHKSKAGTPTMGGTIFIVPTVVTTIALLLMGKIDFSINLLIVLFVFVSYSCIGFIDDYVSITHNRNAGLTVKQKLFLQFLIALVVYILFRHFGTGSSVLEITFLHLEFNLGWFYGIFILILLVGFSNAVNLTDGLDGLAGGLSGIAFLAFGLIAMGSTWATGYKDISIFCFILAGALLGFLVYNGHPAKVFMGDMGSLSLGATLAVIAVITSHEMSLFLIGGVFVLETLSVIIQVFSYSLFHKRVFLMTPIHHHFEKLGWTEKDIVTAFWTFGFILALLALIYGVWL